MQLDSTGVTFPLVGRIPKLVKDYLSRQGKRTGRKGGLKRAAGLTPERRSEIARKAANARWAKKEK
jgi:hypothetical protein